MNDKKIFERYMEGMGVRKLGNTEVPGKTSDAEEMVPLDDPAADHQLFLRALSQMELPEDKDTPPPERHRLHKIRPVKSKRDPGQDLLDLHGKTRAEAVAALQRFVTKAFGENLKAVTVVTGKGQHSPGGRSILKPEVENWIVHEGKRFIRAYSEAPRAFGGRGAFILYLRQR